MKLLEKTQFGNLELKNRMAMAAMTRSRADIHGVVGEMTVEYYTQRASAGLLFTEAIRISEEATGSPLTPGIFTNEQIEAWKKVTQAVHDKGGVIIAQLWHTGRVGHSTDRKGKLPLAPSALPIRGMQHFTSQGMKEYETPQAITLEEIKQTIKDFGQAAKNAIEAGFDGVELHAANGYLPSQFLAESSNQRTDKYGGSIPNKVRFALEVMKELIKTVGGDKVGIKISPLHPYGDMILDAPVETYSYLIEELNKLDFAYVELMKRSPSFPSPSHYPNVDDIELFGNQIKQTVIANSGYDKASAEEELEKGIASMVSFGTLFLANPDLPKRFELNTELNQPDRATMFGGSKEGYIDYPFINK
ncbi:MULTISPECIES: alkene reductase [Mesonia]|uniref:N-ethylmaleimide reductase n=1 Tax=Mesonia oceanica TaxID=2687242 RepID=A0AC61YD38_9FLAO|nr:MULTISPECIES: alkene reductase [Mesonia]MAN26007.1 alkene reductase [Mesonia sp.]MAQ41750.1 alkene reductase [Mesonia sp.]MBJ98828.1 alkene reductase [Flavobacteriaceae bacterium]VVV02431.1 N-ethylmaleimide reductase [Mesonia oceanica]|tara:strand:+ start:3629 stop:4711 length:1083 start_codon:yes stop_codon:yes gene_type:complete